MLFRIKYILQIASLIVGVVLGCVTVWQQLEPRGDLVADLLETVAQPPPETRKDIQELPSKVIEAFLKDENLRKLLPSQKLRQDITTRLKSLLEEQTHWISDPFSPRNRLIVFTVRNESDHVLKKVRLSSPLGLSGMAVILGPNQTPITTEIKGIVEFGDLPPRTSVQLFSWDYMLAFVDPDSMTLSHEDGVGEIHPFLPVPVFIAKNGGIFFSYKHTLIWALVGVLVIAGSVGIFRSQRNRRAARHP